MESIFDIYPKACFCFGLFSYFCASFFFSFRCILQPFCAAAVQPCRGGRGRGAVREVHTVFNKHWTVLLILQQVHGITQHHSAAQQILPHFHSLGGAKHTARRPHSNGPAQRCKNKHPAAPPTSAAVEPTQRPL